MQNISDPTAILKREDLIAMEGPLYATLAPFFPGMSLSLFFPPKVPENMRTEHGYTILEEKDRLLLPLVQNNTLLGIMVARRTKDQSTEMPKTEVLTPVLDLCLENLRLYKAKRTDPLTELYNRGTFLDIAARDIEQICSGLESGASAWPESTFKAMFSVMVVKVDNLRHISSRYGFALSDRVLQQAAGYVKQAAPDHAVAARLEGDDEIALLLSNTNHRAGKQLARDIAAKVAGIELRTPLTRERVVLSVSAGLASFPQDIDGPGGGNAPLDTARNILEKARTARRYAAGLNRPFCAFSRILRSGGRIIEPLPLGR
ncbi:MAG: GGDEF domain-containing protein, partial [Desulfonatronovibrionaceae bacterium]